MDAGINFSIISAALILASFLPMLAYSYAKGLFEEISREVMGCQGKQISEELKEKANAIFYFYSAMDFLVTESVFLVFHSGLVALTIYLMLPGPNQQIKDFTKLLGGIFLVIWFLIYIGFSFVFSLCLLQKVYAREENRWPDWRCYAVVCYSSIICYALTGIILSINVCMRSNPVIYFKWILSLATMMLILFACSWVIPSINYTPLKRLRDNISLKLN